MTEQEIARLKELASQLVRGYANYPQDIPLVRTLSAIPDLISALEEARREIQELQRSQEDCMDDAHRLQQRAEQAEATAAAMREALGKERTWRARAEVIIQKIAGLGGLSHLHGGEEEVVREASAFLKSGGRKQRDYNAHLLQEAHKEILRLERIIEGAFESLKDFGADLDAAASEAAKWIDQTKAGQDKADTIQEAMSSALRAAKDWLLWVWPQRRSGEILMEQIDEALEQDPVKDWPGWPSLSLAYGSPDNKFQGIVVGQSQFHGLVGSGEVVEHIKKLEKIAEAARALYDASSVVTEPTLEGVKFVGFQAPRHFWGVLGLALREIKSIHEGKR